MIILYVEDDKDLREVVSEFLKEFYDAELITSSSGNKAMAMIRSGLKVDLIVSDYLMADGNGADLQKFMKESNIQIPSIIYTNSLNPILPIVSDKFLGIIQKHQWEKLVSTINAFDKSRSETV